MKALASYNLCVASTLINSAGVDEFNNNNRWDSIFVDDLSLDFVGSDFFPRFGLAFSLLSTPSLHRRDAPRRHRLLVQWKLVIFDHFSSEIRQLENFEDF